MTVRVRFAPSPTGYLHYGNARGALINWLFARQAGGRLLLRLDDTDLERSTAEYAAAIDIDLAWLGLTHDDYARQSDRLARYAAVTEDLKARGLLYPAYETPDELTAQRAFQRAHRRPPIYDRSALKLTDAQRAAFEAEGRRPHWRFKLGETGVAWADLIEGDKRFPARSVSDPVLIKPDGQPLYTLASVIDDVDFAITHVIRGADHVTNTAVQIEIFQALGAEPPRFAHFPLVVDASGEGPSKRLGSLSLASLRADGIEAATLTSYLAALGSGHVIEPATLDELAARFSFESLSKASPRFDMVELRALNARLLHGLDYAAVADRLPAGCDEALWLAVRPNLTRLADVGDWLAICHDDIAPPELDEGDRNFCREALAQLPADPWDMTSWKSWTTGLKAATGRQGKTLFLPLRRALTGRDHGPEMAALLPLIGRRQVVRRLTAAAA